MNNISKYRLDYKLATVLICFFIISILSILSATTINAFNYSIVYKQIAWIIFGIVIIFLIMYSGIDFIYEHINKIYIIGNICLLFLLIFASPINNAKCWFKIPGIGTIQPSEFMKIILIIGFSKLITEESKKYKFLNFKSELKILIKVFIYLLIPSILTFLEPDTGAVIMYLIITIGILFVSRLRLRWFLGGVAIIVFLISCVLMMYFYNINLFIKILGPDFFLRVERLTNWFNTSGMQLENGLISIGTGGIIGNGFMNAVIYFPEAHTDFIFAVFSSNFGYIGSLILIILIIIFDIQIINLAIKSKKKKHKYMLIGISCVLAYQQIQNISMTFGLLPITGITLPFISYGGSSLISYMIMIGIVFHINNLNIRYHN